MLFCKQTAHAAQQAANGRCPQVLLQQKPMAAVTLLEQPTKVSVWWGDRAFSLFFVFFCISEGR